MLYPQMTESRLLVSLDGLWDFQLDTAQARAPGWAGCRLPSPMPIAVPAAFNDQYPGQAFREHVGDVLYQRTVQMPKIPAGHRAYIRFGSVTHGCDVFLNGNQVATHKGGFLPFAADITDVCRPGENLLTLRVSTIVDDSTLPCGRLQTLNVPGLAPKRVNLPNFDFFNYAGIMRPVYLMILPAQHMKDIRIVAHADGAFSYAVETSGGMDAAIHAEVLHPDGTVLAALDGMQGAGQLSGITPWAPKTPVLYTLRVTMTSGDQHDVYDEPFGFRDVQVEDCQILLNGEPVYLRGFGKHEDSPIQGRGLNEAYNVHDIALMQWMGANSMRTSHYPYSEEFMRLCDRQGILVIDEAPAVGLHTGFTAVGLLGGEPNGTWTTLRTHEHHCDVLRDMIARDKNHPCVILWSVANEPASEEPGAKEYFAPLIDLVHTIDPQKRPATIVTYGGSTPEACQVAELCDVLVLNRYYGWYDQAGDLETAVHLLRDELLRFHKRCPHTPIMLGEYGADTIAGMHDVTPSVFSEEYQAEMLIAYGKTLDSLPFICGEHVWNFADFATATNIQRVQGNKKGVFTRDRKPKLAAHALRARWLTQQE